MNRSSETRSEMRDDPRRKCLREIRDLRSRAGRGLWAMALFLVVSLGAFSDFDFLPPLPPSWMKILGPGPPVWLINSFLVLYSFSALLLILARMMQGSETFRGFGHVGYLTGFFIFYHFSGAMEENFWAIFTAGVTILGLESYHQWVRFAEAIRKAEETLIRLEKN